MTFWYKRIFPIIWFGLLAFVLITVVVTAFTGPENDEPLLPFILVPLVMAAFGYAVMSRLVFDLMDEVWDEGSTLLFRNGGTKVRVDLADILNVSYSVMYNPQRVTMTLRSRTALGSELTFCPPIILIPFMKHPAIGQLTDRIDEARATRGAGDDSGKLRE
jgi:hypothetical protein